MNGTVSPGNSSRLRGLRLDLALQRTETLVPISVIGKAQSKHVVPVGTTSWVDALQTEDATKYLGVSTTTDINDLANLFYFSPVVRNHFPILRAVRLEIVCTRATSGAAGQIRGTLVAP